MRKMPTLFVREYGDGGRVVRVLPVVTSGCEWVLDGEGAASEKVDGSCCAIIGGVFYRRCDAKAGRRVPDGGIPCQRSPDPATGHWPYWVPVKEYPRAGGPDKWLVRAYNNSVWNREDGTYEAVGLHFQANPYGLDDDFLERHGRIRIEDCPRDFDGIREYLRTHEIEGIVWRREDGKMCKIKRRDFGFPWPVKGE